MNPRTTADQLYGRWLRRQLRGLAVPRHVAVVMDGNRRWARRAGYDDVRLGHRHGAEHLETFLGWCSDLGIRDVPAVRPDLRPEDLPPLRIRVRTVDSGGNSRPP